MLKTNHEMKRLRGSVVVAGLAALVVLMSGLAFAGHHEADAAVEAITGGEQLKDVNYKFLDAGYDSDNKVLHYAVADGQHFEHTVNLYFSVPVEDINGVSVISNADKTQQGDKVKWIGNDMAPNDTGFARVKQGCSVKINAKTQQFAWGELGDDAVADGKLVKTPDPADLEKVHTVLVGFYECAHARDVQNKIHDLHKYVQKQG